MSRPVFLNTEEDKIYPKFKAGIYLSPLFPITCLLNANVNIVFQFNETLTISGWVHIPVLIAYFLLILDAASASSDAMFSPYRGKYKLYGSKLLLVLFFILMADLFIRVVELATTDFIANYFIPSLIREIVVSTTLLTVSIYYVTVIRKVHKLKNKHLVKILYADRKN